MADESFDDLRMQRALQLASDSAGLASPNPQVGCVLVKEGRIIGEAAHLYDQRDHAEIAALKIAAEAGFDVRGSTAYVTLEPCSHHGRTPPCADALIAAGIARVVVATIDPNPLVSGQGIARLKGAGVSVTLGVSEPLAREINQSFAHVIETHTPFVTLKAALSVDGKLAPSASNRLPNQPHWLTGSAARAEVQRLRHASDAILTGIGTVLADDPALTDRSGLLRRRPLLRIVLDTNLRIPPSSQLIRSAADDLILCYSANAPAPRIAALKSAGAEVLILPEQDGRLSLTALLAALADRRILSLLLEAGSTLNAAFLRQQLVNRIILFYAETELGPDALPFAEGFESSFALERNLTHLRKTSFGPDVCVSGLLRDPWAGVPSSSPWQIV